MPFIAQHDLLACRANDFKTIMPAPGLFGKDAAYWQSVHQVGEGLEKEKQEAAKKEKEAWQAKVTNLCLHSGLWTGTAKPEASCKSRKRTKPGKQQYCCLFTLYCIRLDKHKQEAAEKEKSTWQAKVNNSDYG